LGLASICLTARYGYKSADTVIDGVISAVVFGSIALCAFLFDAAAVRLWFMKHRVGSGVIGFIADQDPLVAGWREEIHRLRGLSF
jgi:hypothetical protein